MKKMTIVMMAVVLVLCAASYAWSSCGCGKKSTGAVGKETADIVTGTTRTAAAGTANVVQASVRKPVDAPLTGVKAVTDTANTALQKADALISTVTGDKE